MYTQQLYCRHLAQKCKLTCKKLENLPAAGNTKRLSNCIRRELIMGTMQDLNFAKNCISLMNPALTCIPVEKLR
jgi:hypothetical protein